MPPIGLQKTNGGENTKGNPKGDQITHLQGWIIRPTKSN
jgi:hypothetical protein